MARTPSQRLIHKLKRTEFTRGRLTLKPYRIDILPSGKWYISRDGSPIVSGRYQSVANAREISTKALRKVIRSENP